jgi:Holliday junction resolvase RusA-like endonuclease
MTVICFNIPGQPQGKGRARVGKINGHARMFTPSKTVAYEGLVAHVAHLAMAGLGMLEGPCSVSMDIVCQIPASWSAKKQRQALLGELRPVTKPDIDNVEKAVFDGCNGVVWRDDVQVVDVRKSKRYGDKPMITVVISYALPGYTVFEAAQELAQELRR